MCHSLKKSDYQGNLPNTEQSHLDRDWFAEQPYLDLEWFTEHGSRLVHRSTPSGPDLDHRWFSNYRPLLVRSKFLLSVFTSHALIMVHIIGASSLYTACEPLFYSFRRRSPKNIYRLPGLRFCHKNSLKILILFSRGTLRNKSEIVLWHNLKNTTIPHQSSNNKKPWTPERLVSEIDNYKNHISAVVYCR